MPEELTLEWRQSIPCRWCLQSAHSGIFVQDDQEPQAARACAPSRTYATACGSVRAQAQTCSRPRFRRTREKSDLGPQTSARGSTNQLTSDWGGSLKTSRGITDSPEVRGPQSEVRSYATMKSSARAM